METTLAQDSPQATSAKLAILAYNGLQLSVPGLGPFIIDLSGMGLGENIPILADHTNALGSLVGHGTAEVKAHKLHVSATANGVTDTSKAVIELARGRVPLQASVGITIVKRQFLAQGDTAEVNGRSVRAGAEGLMLVRKSTLNEVSVTPLGVDGQTSVSIAAKRDTKMTETDNDTIQLAQKQAREDFLKIEELCDGLEFQNDMTARVKQLKLSAVRGEIDREALLVGLMKLQQDDLKLTKDNRQPTPRPPPSTAARETSTTTCSNALCASRSICPRSRTTTRSRRWTKPAASSAGWACRETLDLAARANGYQGRGCRSGDIKEVLRHAFIEQLQLSGGPSTVSLPNILGAVANKELLAGFTEEDNSWKEIAAVKPVSNFHTHTSFRLMDDLSYVKISPDGTFPQGRIDESQAYTRSVDTYGISFELTRKQITNDDLGALDDLRTRIGRGGAKAFNVVFWQAFLNAISTLFTTGRGNYISGSTTNLGTDGVGLEAAILKFKTLKSPSPEDGTPGKRIGGVADRLIIPPELSFNADRLHQSVNLIGGSSPTPEANIHVSKYRPVEVPFLSDSTFSNYSTTAWGLFRAPAQLAAMVVSFLTGQQTPTVESAAADFDHLGIRFRAFHDFGADDAEYLAGVWSKGAS